MLLVHGAECADDLYEPVQEHVLVQQVPALLPRVDHVSEGAAVGVFHEDINRFSRAPCAVEAGDVLVGEAGEDLDLTQRRVRTPVRQPRERDLLEHVLVAGRLVLHEKRLALRPLAELADVAEVVAEGGLLDALLLHPGRRRIAARGRREHGCLRPCLGHQWMGQAASRKKALLNALPTERALSPSWSREERERFTVGKNTIKYQ